MQCAAARLGWVAWPAVLGLLWGTPLTMREARGNPGFPAQCQLLCVPVACGLQGGMRDDDEGVPTVCATYPKANGLTVGSSANT